ncbi:MAG: NAD(P)-dependent alcohol dehydrogenase [Chloroflexi bacterium]|nr:NAD(P)-dependent alcohol dehydrogenase [Chloroflexota bacterium]
MKAVVYTEFGSPDVLHVSGVEKPTPKDNEVLVRVHATTVNFGDLIARNMSAWSPARFTMPFLFYVPTRFAFGLRRPTKSILGSEYAGVIEGVGKDVTRFKAGDKVFGYRGQTMGTYAEYITAPEDSPIAPMPSNMTFEEAASIPYGAITALNLLKKANIQPGQKVLINGASGSIGSAAMQLAKHYGAEVTGVAGSKRIPMLEALGADKTIDYTREDFTARGEQYDLILDVIRKSSFEKAKRALTPNGIYMLASFKMKQVFQMLRTRFTGGKQVICALAFDKPGDLDVIKELIEAGALKSAVDRSFPLEQAAAAHRYVESGDRTGSVVLAVA